MAVCFVFDVLSRRRGGDAAPSSSRSRSSSSPCRTVVEDLAVRAAGSLHGVPPAWFGAGDDPVCNYGPVVSLSASLFFPAVYFPVARCREGPCGPCRRQVSPRKVSPMSAGGRGDDSVAPAATALEIQQRQPGGSFACGCTAAAGRAEALEGPRGGAGRGPDRD